MDYNCSPLRLLTNSKCVRAPRVNVEINSVHLMDDFEVASIEEIMCRGELRDINTDLERAQYLLVEPNPNVEEKYSILIGRVLIDPASWPFSILLVNFGPTFVHLKPGIKLAFTDPVTIAKQAVFAIAENSNAKTRKSDNGANLAIANINTEPPSLQFDQLVKLLHKHYNVFSSGPMDLGRTFIIKHEIDTGENLPIQQAPRGLPHSQLDKVNDEVNRMIQTAIVQPSQSPWASPIVIVLKKDGSIRLCIDYRKENAVTKKDADPLPRIEDLFDTLAGSKYFATLDMASEYHQVEVSQKDRQKTAFVTLNGIYEYQVMPFGLCNAPPLSIV